MATQNGRDVSRRSQHLLSHWWCSCFGTGMHFLLAPAWEPSCLIHSGLAPGWGQDGRLGVAGVAGGALIVPLCCLLEEAVKGSR